MTRGFVAVYSFLSLPSHVTRWSKVLLPLYYLSLVAVCAIVMVSFFLFAPFTYGYPALTREQINWRHWSVSWDLLHR